MFYGHFTVGFVLSAFLGMSLAQAASPPTTLAVDLRDIAKFQGTAIPEAAAVLNAMQTTPTDFFPAGVTLAPVGVGRSQIAGIQKQLKNQVYGVEFESPLTTQGPTGRRKASIIAFYHQDKSGFWYSRYDVAMEGAPLHVVEARLREKFPSSDTHFSAQVGLIQRKVILVDSRHGVRKIFPVAPGGFDEGITPGSGGKTRLMTPEFAHATFDRATVIPARTDPAYYAGMPFIRITTRTHRETGYAFHIIQHPGSAPNGPDYNFMIRGFDSHGCMRLREKDLYEFHAILMTHDSQQLGLDVRLRIAEKADHPYPLRDDGYVSVVNFGTKEAPVIHLDEHDLIVMADVKRPPPLSALSGIEAETFLSEGLLP